MNILVTGSSGHLGEALVRVLRETDHRVFGTDLKDSSYTDFVGSITEQEHVKTCMAGVNAVLHTATLHKPHITTHSCQDFVTTNISGTLNLLEQAVIENVQSFIFTSTTSAFGDALTPHKSTPAAWITEDVIPIPKNIYGITKVAAENLCRLFYRNHGLPCLILRTSRFFPEEDDNKVVRSSYEDENVKANEFLYRRVDIEDVVSAHILAMEKASKIEFSRYIISATTPFTKDDLLYLRLDAPSVLERRIPEYKLEYERRGWKMFPSIERVYVNEHARRELGWIPRNNFSDILSRLMLNKPLLSPLAYTIGTKGYHDATFPRGQYPFK
jgi:nucleoside-diphosphate-sugar epimerase